MEYFIVINLLVASALAPSIITDLVERLPATKSTELVLVDPPRFIFKWEPVESDLEPVLGYKLSDFKPQDGKLHEYILTGANHTQLVVNNVKERVPYMFEVLAFGASGDGYSSSYIGSALNTITGNNNNPSSE